VYVLCGILILILVLLHRQNVVIVGAGRSSRSAKFATSSELLYLLNLLYNMPSECCVEYKLIQLYQKSSVWCFAFSHTSTFELIPAVIETAQSGALVTIGGETALSHAEQRTLTEIRRTVQHRGHYAWKKETSEYMIPTEVQPAYEPAVVERYRFEARVHGVQQVETAATSTLAHVQQFAVASTTETTETLVGRADVE